MSEQNVTVRISHAPNGSTNIDFSGFLGEGCFAFGEELRTRMAKRGLKLEDLQITRKPEADAVVVDLTAGVDQVYTVTQEE